MEQAQNYRDSGPIRKIEGDSEFYYVLNAKGTTASKGVPYELTIKGAAATIGGVSVVVAQYTPVLPRSGGVATASARICVPLADIADGAWGWVQVKGHCPYIVTSSTIAANDQLTVGGSGVSFTALNTGVTMGGAAIAANAFALAQVNVTTNVWTAYLFGRQQVITTEL